MAPPLHSYGSSATISSSRPRRTLKSGDTFIVVDSHGDIGTSVGGPDGLFHADTRHLSRLGLEINGLPPLLLGANLRDDNAVLSVDLTNPDLYFDRRLVLPKDTVHIVRTLFLWRGLSYYRFGLRNFGDRRVAIRLTISFESDFADLFEVRGMRRERRGTIAPAVVGGDRVVLSYSGLDHAVRHTTLLFDPRPTEIEIDLRLTCSNCYRANSNRYFLPSIVTREMATLPFHSSGECAPLDAS